MQNNRTPNDIKAKCKVISDIVDSNSKPAPDFANYAEFRAERVKLKGLPKILKAEKIVNHVKSQPIVERRGTELGDRRMLSLGTAEVEEKRHNVERARHYVVVPDLPWLNKGGL